MTRQLVVLSLESWNEVWRRNQFLVSGLLRADRGLEVLFVEPALDPLHDLRSGRRPRPGRGLCEIDGYDSRLTTYQPTKWLPRVLGTMADRLLEHEVHAALRELGWKKPLLWVNDPSWAVLVRDTGWPALYDVTDDWLLAQRSPRVHRRLVEDERILLTTCQEVVVCSPGLAVEKGRDRTVEQVPNAVDTQRFRAPAPRPADLPVGRTALYAGTMHEDRLDVSLSVAAARELRAVEGSLVFLGPNALENNSTTRLRAEPNIVILGARPNRDVPAYLQHATVLAVPHVVDEFTDSLDPIKLYEYLAVGRPVVSTAVAGFRERAGEPGIRIAGPGSFASEIVAAVTAEPTVLHDEIPDWTTRVAAMSAVLDRLE